MNDRKLPYQQAQEGIAALKSAVHQLLHDAGENGLRNADIGHMLGINAGHSGRHEGHIPRVLLARMEEEGIVHQKDSDKRWALKDYGVK